VQRVRGAASGAPAQRAQISLFWLWAMEYTVHAGRIGNVFSGLGCVQSGPLGRCFFDTGCTANCCGHSNMCRHSRMQLFAQVGPRSDKRLYWVLAERASAAA
jgi:hypothetical protein